MALLPTPMAALIATPAVPHTCTTIKSVVVAAARTFVHVFGGSLAGLPVLSSSGVGASVGITVQIDSIGQVVAGAVVLAVIPTIVAFTTCMYEYLGTKG